MIREHLSGTDNSIRGVFIGGVTPTAQNVIDHITIATTGDAQDFGDLIAKGVGYSGSTFRISWWSWINNGRGIITCQRFQQAQ